MNSSDDKLQIYIRKILEIQNRKKETSLTKEEFHQLIQELDLSEQDRDAISEAFAGYMKRGQGFRRYNLWDSAIEEFSQAAAVEPFNTEPLLGLADAHFNRWKENGEEEDQKTAEAYARQCLGIDASCEEALKLISQLKKGAAKGRKKKGGRWLLMLAILLIAGGGILGLWVYSHSPTVEVAPPPVVVPEEIEMPAPLNPPPQPVNIKEPKPQPPVPAEAPPADLPPVNAMPALNQPLIKAAPTTPALPGEQEIPVVLQKNEHASHIKMAVEHSILSRYNQSYAYKLHADLMPEDREITQLKMQVQAISPDGTVLFTDWTDALRDYQPSVRPGDVAPFGYLHYKKEEAPEIKEVRLSVSLMQTRPAPDSYEPSPVLPFTWEGKKPQNVDLKIGERQNSWNNNFVNLAFEVENTGRIPLTALKFEIQWMDRDKRRIILSKPLYIVTTSGPGFKPGQRRVAGGTYRLPETEAADSGTYQVKVVSVSF